MHTIPNKNLRSSEPIDEFRDLSYGVFCVNILHTQNLRSSDPKVDFRDLSYAVFVLIYYIIFKTIYCKRERCTVIIREVYKTINGKENIFWLYTGLIFISALLAEY